MTKLSDISRQFLLVLGISIWLSDVAGAHSGIVDSYGCHRGPDKVSYHCHQGAFAGRKFKSKEEFLRQLRGGKSEQLSPKNNPPAERHRSTQHTAESVSTATDAFFLRGKAIHTEYAPGCATWWGRRAWRGRR